MEIRYLSGMNVSQSGLAAQRRQMDVAAENLANAYTTRTESGDPYRRQVVSFEAVAGRKTEAPLETQPAPLTRTDPAHLGTTMTKPAVTPEPGGVAAQVSEDASDFPTVHDPGHPDADEEGNVRLPNVDQAQELVTMMIAARAYEANVAALGAARTVADAALDLAR